MSARAVIALWLLRCLYPQALAKARSAVLLPCPPTSSAGRQSCDPALAPCVPAGLCVLPPDQAQPLLALAGKTGGRSVRIRPLRTPGAAAADSHLTGGTAGHGWGLAFAIVALALLLVLAYLMPESKAAEELTPCGSTPAEPPLITLLPDGTTIATTRLLYHIEASTVEVIGYPRLFCDGFEGGGA